MENSVNCPICGAENPATSDFCGLCLHYFGSTFSKGLIEPPKWYSASDYKMVYSESSFLTGQLRKLEREIEAKAKVKGSNEAYISERIKIDSESAKPTAWI